MTDIALLIHRFLKEELTHEEKQKLESWKGQSETNRRIYEKLTNDDYLLETVTDSFKIDSDEEAKQKIHILIGVNQQAIGKDEEISSDKIKPIWPRLSAAAAILLLLAVSTLYILRKNKHTSDDLAKTSHSKTDIPPGSNKATLKLADGSVIVLDSISTGQLAQQGNTQVLNKSGQLVYTSSNGSNKSEVLWNVLSTSKGQTYPLLLGDGTLVTLNAGSSIKFPVAFTGNRREVEVTGEIFFQVEHDARKPFIVKVKNMELQVLGTTFNVNAYDNEDAIKTTLVEGKVKLRSTANNTQVILAPGEQAQLQIQSQALTKTKDIDTDVEVAWRFGYFSFRNTDIKSVMRQLERWYNVSVEYRGDIGEHELWGKLKRSLTLSQVLSILEIQKVHVKIEGKKIIVTP